MSTELGPTWRSHFSSFNPIPIASASIGQVHAGVLASNGMPVAVKVQFPGVKESIDSDLNNLSLVLAASALLPKGLFLESTIKAIKVELADECDYLREADCARRFRKELEGDDRFEVMRVVGELCTSKVLTMERMSGVPVVQAEGWSQDVRDRVRTIRRTRRMTLIPENRSAQVSWLCA
jgi:aarF domain-containing kinase